MGTYLEEYLDSIITLPAEIKRNFDLMRELDKDSNALVKDIKDHHKKFLQQARKRVKEAPSGSDLQKAIEDEELMHMIRAKRQKAIEKSDEKIAIAMQTYDLVDQHIQRLDADLAKFEQNLRANGEFEDEKEKKRKRQSTGGGRRKATAEETAAVQVPSTDDLPVDPNEPIYCFCRRVSFGQMVGCDNDECKYEWFHFECVGLTQQPVGKWYCNDCRSTMANKKH